MSHEYQKRCMNVIAKKAEEQKKRRIKKLARNRCDNVENSSKVHISR